MTTATAEFVEHLEHLPPEDRAQAWSQLRMMAAPMLDPEKTTGKTPAVAALAVENLADLDDDKMPAILADVIVEAQVNWLCGHPEHMKTTIAMHAALTAARDGRDVLWLDWEGGRAPSKRRLTAMGATAEDFARIHYAYAPRISADADGLRSLLDVLDTLDPGPVVVFDSASKALSAAGLSENSPEDATKWTTEVVMPLREVATIIVIDHVVKNATRSTPYARGSGSKLADTEVMWYVEAEVKPNRATVGRVALHKHKDREGVLPECLRFEVGDGQGRLPVTRLAEDESSPRATDSKARLTVLGLLRKHDGEELSTTQIEQMATGASKDLREAAAQLAADPSQPVSSRPGQRNSVLYKHDLDAASALEL